MNYSKKKILSQFIREIFKNVSLNSNVKHKIAPKLMCELFQETVHPYNLRNDYTFKTFNGNTVHYGTETLSFMGP